MIVVDVNVVAYLLIEGEKTAAARDLQRRDPDWRLPALWRHEYARTTFEALHARICDALRGDRPRVVATLHTPDGRTSIAFEDGTAEDA